MLLKKLNRETTPDLNKWWSCTTNRKFVRSIPLIVTDTLKKPVSGAAAAKGQSKCNRNPKGTGRGSRPSSSPRRNSWERETPTGKSPKGKENQPTCVAYKEGDFPDGNACGCWHPPECFSHQNGSCKLGNVHTSKRKGWRRTEEAK